MPRGNAVAQERRLQRQERDILSGFLFFSLPSPHPTLQNRVPLSRVETKAARVLLSRLEAGFGRRSRRKWAWHKGLTRPRTWHKIASSTAGRAWERTNSPIDGELSSASVRQNCSGADVISDAQLIDEALAGDSSAFGQLVQKYQDRLFNTIVHVAGGREEAEDVVQEAFVQAFVKLDTFRGKSAFYTWLYRIAFNVAVSRRRRKRPEVSVEHSRELSGNEPLDAGESPGARVERRERADQVQTALAMLSEDHRAILTLREMEGCEYETIAEILDLPVGTVRSRLHRARIQLKDLLLEIDHGTTRRM